MLVVAEDVFGAEQLVAAVGVLVAGVFEAPGGLSAGPAVEVAHVGAQTGFVADGGAAVFGVRFHLARPGVDVGAVTLAVEQVAVGFAVGMHACADAGAGFEHPHRVAGGREGVDFDVGLFGGEVVLLDFVG